MQSLLRVLLLALLFPAAATAAPADQTGTGGGPRSTITAPHTTSTGTTKPPGVEEGPATPAERRALKGIERQNDTIDSSICVGCGR